MMLLLSKINFIGLLVHRVIAEELTSQYDDLGLKCERDAFDTLFDHAPDKLQVVNFIFHIEVSKSQDRYISNFLHNFLHNPHFLQMCLIFSCQDLSRSN